MTNSDPPKLGYKKTESVIAFRIALTLDVKIVWFVSINGIEMQFFGVVGFKSSTLTVY